MNFSWGYLQLILVEVIRKITRGRITGRRIAWGGNNRGGNNTWGGGGNNRGENNT
jgi:hypothetical protein